MDHARAEVQVGQRCGQVDQPRQPVQEVQHRVEVAQPLRPVQPAAEQRVVDAEDLRHAARPADALAHVARQALGRQARGLRQREVGGVPAAAVHLQRGVGVLGHGLDRDAADFLDRRAAQHRAGAAEEARVPEVVAVLDQAVEQLALVGHRAEGVEVALERVGREEIVGQLDHGQLRVAVEPAHRDLHERARGDVVAVEDRDELGAGVLERGIDVTGLGVAVVVARDVGHAHGIAELTELGAPAVVEHVDLDLVARPVDGLRGQHRRAHHRHRLVVGRDEQVDGRPLGRVRGQRRGLAAQRPGGLDVAQQQHDEGVELGHEQADAQHQVDDVVHVHRLGDAPVGVARGDDHRQQHQHQAREMAAEAVHEQGREEDADRQHQLLLEGHGRDDQRRCRREQDQPAQQPHRPQAQEGRRGPRRAVGAQRGIGRGRRRGACLGCRLRLAAAHRDSICQAGSATGCAWVARFAAAAAMRASSRSAHTERSCAAWLRGA